MWHTWHIVKFDYAYPADTGTQTKLVAYHGLAEAQRVFDLLELSYQLNQPIRIKGGKMIKVVGVWPYESLEEHYSAAMDAAKSGTATLLCDAREIEIDI